MKLDDILTESGVPTDKALYNTVKSEIKSKFDKWPSAYASAALVKEYKKRGGGYKSKTNESLDTWFKEKWVDVSRKDKDGKHPECGRDDADKGAYPKCTPKKKADSMSKKEKKSASDRKRKAENKNTSSTPKFVSTKS